MSASVKQVLFALVIVMLGAVAARAMLLLKDEPEQQTLQRAPLGVQVKPVAKQDRVLQLQAQGVVKAQREIQLVSEVSGRVLWVSEAFHSGGLIAEGEKLLKIDPTDYQVALAEAKAAQLTAELDYNDKRARYQKSSLSVQQSFAQLEFAKKRVAQAERDLQNTEIKAPFAALLVSKQADLGQYVSKGSAIAHLASTAIAELRVPVHRDEITLLSDNPFAGALENPVTLSIMVGGQVYARAAKLSRIEAQVDADTRVYYAVVNIEDPYNLHMEEGDAIPPVIIGSFVNAAIQSKTIKQSAELPVQVLQNDDTVFVVDKENKLQKKPVQVVHRLKDILIVNQGLEAGEQVVVTPVPQMFAGMEVTVLE